MRTVALSAVAVLAAALPALTAKVGADPKAPGVPADVLAAVEDELARLSDRAATEAGPAHPRPAEEVAFLLLSGLAGRGAEVQRPTAEEYRQLGVRPSNQVRLRVFAVAEDARIVFSAETIQDKAGDWTSKRAVLYRRRGDRWVERGGGSTATDGASSGD
jgi:hypothetical protein